MCVAVAMVAALGVPERAGASGPTAPGVPTGVTVVPAVAGVAVSWVAPVSDGGSALTGFVVSPSVGDPVTVDPGMTSTVVSAPVGSPVSVSVVAVNAVGSSSAVGAGPVTPTAPGGLVRAVSPKRLVDSRYGTGVAKGKLGANAERLVQVTGRAGVPSSGVASVFVNVMALDVDANTSLRVWPDGSSAPGTSSLDALRAERIIQMVQVQVGTGGRIRVRNGAGATNVVLDVVGYSLTAAASGGSTNGLVTTTAPTEVLNTRTGFGAPRAKLGEKKFVDATVLGRGGVPATGVAAVFVNLTAYGPSKITGLTVYPAGPLPGTQNLSAVPGVNRTNRVLVPVAPGGKVRIYNQFGTVDVKLDVAGWVSNGTDPSLDADSLNPQAPARLVDTRTGTGAPKAPLAKGAEITVTAAGRAGVPALTAPTPPTAVLAFVRIYTKATTTSVSMRPAGTPWASVADVTGRGTQTMGNLVLVPLSADGKATIRSSPGSSGALDVVVDIVGWVGGSILIAPETKVLTSTDVNAISAVTATGYTLGPGPAAPKVGDIVTARNSTKLPKGMLRRVTGVTVQPNGTRTITTRDAAIGEAVRRGELDATIPLNGPSTVVNPGVSTSGRPTRAIGAGISRSFSQEIVSGVTASGSFAVSATADLTVDIGFLDIDATAEVQASQSIEGSVSASAAASWAAAIDLGEYTFATYYAQIGPVPVVVQPQIELSAETSGEVEGSASMSFNQGISGRAGITYDDGIDSFNEFTNTPPTFTGPDVSAKATATINLVANLELEFYGSGEFGIGLVGGLNLDSTPCGVELTAALSARLSLELEVLGKDLADESIDLPIADWPLADIEIPGLCPYWTGTVTVGGSFSILTPGTIPIIDSWSYNQAWTYSRSQTAEGVSQKVTEDSTYVQEAGDCVTGSGTLTATTSGVGIDDVGAFPDASLEPDGSGQRWVVDVMNPSTGGGTTTSFRCGPLPTGTNKGLGVNIFESALTLALGDLPPDKYTLAGTRTVGVDKLCIDYGCNGRAASGSMTITVQLTRLPDADFDGVPD